MRNNRPTPLDYEKAPPRRPFPTGTAVVLLIFVAGAFFLAGLFAAAKHLRPVAPTPPPPLPTTQIYSPPNPGGSR